VHRRLYFAKYVVARFWRLAESFFLATPSSRPSSHAMYRIASLTTRVDVAAVDALRPA
jgi:hypothetical protein